jgi:hypothetical protein
VDSVKALRKDFNAPDAKFVVSTIAFGGMGAGGNTLKVIQAQLALSGERGKYPEFRGTVKSFGARPFYRGGGAHYGGSAELYMGLGEGLGRATADLLKDTSSKNALKEEVEKKEAAAPPPPKIDPGIAKAEKLF